MTQEGPLVHLREHPELIAADLELLGGHVPPQGRILDIGAGRGAFVQQARRHGFDAFALERQLEAGVVWRPSGVPGVLGDGACSPFADASFDAVRLKEVLEHVGDPLTLVREVRRLLKPGGIAMAHVPTPYSQFYPVGNFWDDYTHVRPFSRVALQRLFADAGLEVLRIDAYTAGRNPVERAVARLIALVLPHIYRVTARR